MGELYVEQCVRNYSSYTKKTKVDKVALEANIKKCLDELNGILTHNYNNEHLVEDHVQVKSGGHIFAIEYANGRRIVEVVNMIQFFASGLHDLQYFNIVQESLQILLSNQLLALDKMVNGSIVGQTFVTSITMPPSSSTCGYINIAKALMADECPDCGHVFSAGALNGHRLSMKCMQATHDRDMREKEWYPLDSSQDIAAARKAGIQFEVRPSHYTMWVPPWAGEAMEQFHKINKGEENTYAGLKLHEFLAKMKPD